MKSLLLSFGTTSIGPDSRQFFDFFFDFFGGIAENYKKNAAKMQSKLV
jgi:hypothetical protein